MRFPLLVCLASCICTLGHSLFSQDELLLALDETEGSVQSIVPGQWTVFSNDVYKGETSIASPPAGGLEGDSMVVIHFEGPTYLEIAFGTGEAGEALPVVFESGAFEIAKTASKDWRKFRAHFPAGSHSLSCTLKKSDGQGRLLLDALEIKRSSFFDFETSGGVIVMDSPEQDWDFGTPVVLTAFALPEWKFSHWEGEQNSSDPQLYDTANNHRYTVVFEKAVEAFGRLFYSSGSQGSWSIEGQELVSPPNGSALTTIVEGPAMVEIGFDFVPKEFRKLEFFRNGVHLSGYTEPNESPIRIPLMTGESEIRIDTDISDARIKYFSVIYGVTVDTGHADNGFFTVTPHKEVYAPGEMVRVEAHADAGYFFVNWAGAVSGTEPRKEIVVMDHIVLDGTFLSDGFGAKALQFEGEVLWEPDPVLKTPEGGETLVAKFLDVGDQAVMKAEVQGPSGILFWAAVTQGVSGSDGFQFLIDGEVLVDEDPSPVGQYFLFDLDEGNHELIWRFSRSATRSLSSRAWVGDVYFGNGNAIALEIIGDGRVERSPNKLFFDIGESVTLKAIPDLNSEFSGWYGDVDSFSEEVVIVMEESKTIGASFTASMDYDGVSWTLGGIQHPFIVEDLGPPGDKTYNWLWPEKVPIPVSWLEGEWEGPGLLQFEMEMDTPPQAMVEVSINGRTLVRETSTRDFESFQLPLEAGSNTVRWTLRRPTPAETAFYFRLRKFEVSEGYFLDVDVAEGEVTQSIEGSMFTKGETVTVESTPPASWEVATDWFGDIQSSEEVLQLPMDRHYQLLRRYGNELEYEGRWWLTSPSNPWEIAAIAGQGDTEFLAYMGEDFTESWVGTKFQGPGILYFDHQISNRLRSLVNGRDVHILDVEGSELGGRIELIAGDNYLEFRYDFEQGSWNTGFTNFDLKPGFFLDTEVSGADLSMVPGERFYNPGTSVDLRLDVHPGNRFRGWSGDLEGTELRKTLVMDDHKEVVAVCSMVDLGFGRNLKLSKNSNWYWQNDYTNNTEFALAGEDRHYIIDPIYLEVEVDGPGLVSFETIAPPEEGRRVYFKVNGEEKHVSNGDQPVEFFQYGLSEGTHVLRWESDDGYGYIPLFLEDIKFIPGNVVTLSIDREAEYHRLGTIESDVEEGAVVAGQPIVLTATPNGDIEFLNWNINGRSYTGNPLTIYPEENVLVEPDFGVTYQGVPYKMVVVDREEPHPDREILASATSEGIMIEGRNFMGNVEFRRRFVGPGVFNLEWKQGPDGFASMSLWPEGAHFYSNLYGTSPGTDWTSFQSELFQLEDRSFWELRFSTSLVSNETGDGQLFFRDIGLLSDLGLGIDPVGGTVKVTPDEGLYAFGSEVTLEAVPDGGNAFLGWGGSLTGLENPKVIEVTQPGLVHAYFGESSLQEFEGITWTIQGQGNIGISKFVNFTNIDILEVPQASAGMVSATFQGPGVIKYQEAIDSGGRLVVFKDGIEITPAAEAVFQGTDRKIYLDEGGQTITFQFRNEFTHHEKDLIIRDFRFIPGWQIEVDVPGSSATILPNKESYETGDIVSIFALVPDGSRFLEWTGGLAGKGSLVIESVSRHILSTGHLSRSLSFRGFDWFTSEAQPWFIEDEGLVSPAGRPGTRRNSVETEVIGPSTLILNWGVVNASPGRDPEIPGMEVWINGQLIADYDPAPLQYEDIVKIELGEGLHRFQVFNSLYELYPGSDYYVQGGILDIYYEVEESLAAEKSYLSLFYDPVELRGLDRSLLSGDPDRDGIQYILERLFGFNPAGKESGLPVEIAVAQDESGLVCLSFPTFAFAKYFEGSLQVSADLRNWRTIDLNDPTVVVSPLSELIDFVTVKVPGSEGYQRAFLRYLP